MRSYAGVCLRVGDGGFPVDLVDRAPLAQHETPEFLLLVLLLVQFLANQGTNLSYDHILCASRPGKDVGSVLQARLLDLRVFHPQPRTAEPHPLLVQDLGQELGGVFPKLQTVYPFAKDTPILEESLFRLKKSSKQASYSSS